MKWFHKLVWTLAREDVEIHSTWDFSRIVFSGLVASLGFVGTVVFLGYQLSALIIYLCGIPMSPEDNKIYGGIFLATGGAGLYTAAVIGVELYRRAVLWIEDGQFPVTDNYILKWSFGVYASEISAVSGAMTAAGLIQIGVFVLILLNVAPIVVIVPASVFGVLYILRDRSRALRKRQ